MENVTVQRLLDRVAIAASGLCMLHWLVTPVLLIVAPILTSTIMADEELHRILVVLVLPTSCISLFLGCRRHKDRMVFILGIVGLMSLVLTAYLGHDVFGELGEKVATVISGVILVSGHFRNYRLCRHDGCDA